MSLLKRGKNWSKKRPWAKVSGKRERPNGSRIERQEIYCHDCNKYVQFNIDMSLNGNHVLKCPSCGHEHCRVVVNGRITDDRWDSRNNNYPVYYVTSITMSSTSTGTGTAYYMNSWSDSTTAAGNW